MTEEQLTEGNKIYRNIKDLKEIIASVENLECNCNSTFKLMANNHIMFISNENSIYQKIITLLKEEKDNLEKKFQEL